jgi:hypothetical protein
LFTAIQLGSAVFYEEATNIILARTGGFIVSCILAYLAWRGKKVAVWVMAILILITGFGGFAVGVFAVSISQYILKPFVTIISIYFIFGGIALLPIH